MVLAVAEAVIEREGIGGNWRNAMAVEPNATTDEDIDI